MPRHRGPTSQAVSPASGPAGLARSTVWRWLLVFTATLVAYAPALSGGFVWDDDGHVTRAGLRSLAGLGRIWFEIGATQQYYPLLHSAFWLEHRLWGDAPLGYHLLNVLLHAANACLFATVLRRLAVPGAWLAALLFALHPVTVESVAWIAEQKNTLSTALYLGAALAYLRFDADRRPRAYVLATVLFVLALLTKTVTATLPAALLVIFWWQRGRLGWRREVVPLLPWFALGAASGWVTATFERDLIGANGADFNFSLVDRLLIAGRVVWFYLGKLVWPADLMFIYPRWTIDPAQAWQWLFPLGALLLVAVLALGRRRSRAPLAVILLFGGTLFPVLGFFNVYPFLFSFVADHFQYLASLAVFAFVAATFTRALAAAPRRSSPAAFAARAGVAVLLVVLGTLTWSQASIYRDGFTLYEKTLAQNPSCWMAHNNLAMALTDSGRVAEAVPHLRRALELRPNYPQAENNLGDDLTRLGRAAEAIPHLEKAIRLQPNYADAQNNLGVALVALGRTSEAIVQYEAALRGMPGYARAENNLGLALATSGRPAEAIPHFQRAVQLDPHDADAELSWGIALMVTGHASEATAHFERAVALAPNSVNARLTLGRALAGHGRLNEAIAQLREAVALAPDSAAARLQLAATLRQAGSVDEAAAHEAEAQRLGAGR